MAGAVKPVHAAGIDFSLESAIESGMVFHCVAVGERVQNLFTTGGTITGCYEVIKPRKNSFTAIAVEPKDSPVISFPPNGK